MTLPETQVIETESPPAASIAVDTGTLFVAGLTEKGPVDEWTLSRNLSQWVAAHGERTAPGTTMYDAADAFFREGGSRLYTGRAVGPTPVTASANIFDQSGSVDPGDVALAVTAVSPGEWANALNVTVTVDGTSFVIAVTHDTDGTLETSPLLEDRAAAVAWAANSDYIRLALGASNEDPRAQGPTSLAGGDDDDSNITEDEYVDALNLFSAELGPGQVAMPGRTTTTAHDNLNAHAEANNRAAIHDFADTAGEGTLITEAETQREGANPSQGAAFGPWYVLPGVAAGTTRTVPPSAVVAGIIARNDADGHSPNEASAGDLGISRSAIGLSQVAWTDAEREQLNDAGFNVIVSRAGVIKVFGWRTFADPDENANYVGFNSRRLLMAIKAEGQQVLDRFHFDQIDGRGQKLGELNGSLVGIVAPYYDAGSLYGDTPQDAFKVETGEQVNPPEDLAQGILRAAIAVRISPFAERVILEITKVANTEVLA